MLLAVGQDDGKVPVVTQAFPRLKALCVLQFGTVRGALILEQTPEGGNTTVEGVLTELEATSSHLLTVHESIIDEEVGCSSAGGIFNPNMTDVPTGMLGALQADLDGVSRVKISSNMIDLIPDSPANVVDRSLIVSSPTVNTELDGEAMADEEPVPLGCCSIARLG